MMFETFAEQDRAQSWFDIGLRLRRRACSFTLITLLLVIVVFVVSCTLMRAGCDLHITIHMDVMKISRPFFCFICHKDVAVTLIPKFPRCTLCCFLCSCLSGVPVGVPVHPSHYVHLPRNAASFKITHVTCLPACLIVPLSLSVCLRLCFICLSISVCLSICRFLSLPAALSVCLLSSVCLRYEPTGILLIL